MTPAALNSMAEARKSIYLRMLSPDHTTETQTLMLAFLNSEFRKGLKCSHLFSLSHPMAGRPNLGFPDPNGCNSTVIMKNYF